MNRQPIRDYQPNKDLERVYRNHVANNRRQNQNLKKLANKRLARQRREEEIRNKWDRFTPEERAARIQKLEEVCNDLINIHPDYSGFKKATVTVDGEMCEIHWNGKRVDENTNWGMVNRCFPVADINIVIKRYGDRMNNLNKDDEL